MGVCVRPVDPEMPKEGLHRARGGSPAECTRAFLASRHRDLREGCENLAAEVAARSDGKAERIRSGTRLT